MPSKPPDGSTTSLTVTFADINHIIGAKKSQHLPITPLILADHEVDKKAEGEVSWLAIIAVGYVNPSI